jgi:hypothetical protein
LQQASAVLNDAKTKKGLRSSEILCSIPPNFVNYKNLTAFYQVCPLVIRQSAGDEQSPPPEEVVE